MRHLTLCAWLLIPAGMALWHYGPGQDYLHRDEAARLIRLAEKKIGAENWAGAVSCYDEALKLLPAGHVAEGWRLRLERDKARMNARRLPAAHEDLKRLVDEIKDSPKCDPALLAEARSALAASQYYMTWVMRLEGQPAEIWEPEIESARQNYRMLAEAAQASGDEAAAARNRDDLESAVRLARMDLGELQGLPLPLQSQGCQSGKGRGRGTTKAPSKQAQPKDARSASAGPTPDKAGR